jgi:hypothetical protein
MQPTDLCDGDAVRLLGGKDTTSQNYLDAFRFTKGQHCTQRGHIVHLHEKQPIRLAI